MQPWDSLRLVVVTAQLLCAEVQRVTVCVCCSNALRGALRRRWSQKVLEGSRRFRKSYPAPLWYSLRESGWRKGGKLHEAVSPEERRRRREAAYGRRCFNFPSHHPNLLKMAGNIFPLSWKSALPVRALSGLPAGWSCEELSVGGEPAALLQCPQSGKAGSKAEVCSPTAVCIHTVITHGSHT